MQSRAVGIAFGLLLIAGPVQAEDRSRGGKAEYLRDFSACHGDDADGNGPVSNVLSPHLSALTGCRKIELPISLPSLRLPIEPSSRV